MKTLKIFSLLAACSLAFACVQPVTPDPGTDPGTDPVEPVEPTAEVLVSAAEITTAQILLKTQGLVEYAYVAWKTKPMVFINVLANISASCDCSSRAPKPFCDDIGMLASKDIVAIDQASFDLVAEKHKCDDPFLKESGKSGLSQLDYAQSLGMGNRKYVLIEIK